jgi:hypothetical protein
MAGGMAQVVNCLPSKPKTLSSTCWGGGGRGQSKGRGEIEREKEKE